jgi:hypothetical protein
LIRETPSKNKGIERPSPVIRLAVKRRNNSEFILDSNELAAYPMSRPAVLMASSDTLLVC